MFVTRGTVLLNSQILRNVPEALALRDRALGRARHIRRRPHREARAPPELQTLRPRRRERRIARAIHAQCAARGLALPIEARRPGLCRAPEFQAVLRRMRLDDDSIAQLTAAGVLEPPPAHALPSERAAHG